MFHEDEQGYDYGLDDVWFDDEEYRDAAELIELAQRDQARNDELIDLYNSSLFENL